MKPLPIVRMKAEVPTVTFDSMPFWTGVQKTPGVRQILPFAITSPIDSPIRQVTSEQIITDVVNAYQSAEYNFITPPPGASEWANSLGENYIEAVKNLIGDRFPRNVLEIGGGSTWIARRLQEYYHPESYVLVDPSVRDAAEGVEVVLDYFPNPQLVGRNFDLVLGFNVLEHVPDPLSFLRSIRSQLANSGKVILIYPDCERQLRRGDLNVFVHEHLSYFTEASTNWLAAAAGFSVLALSRENDTVTVLLKAGSLDSYISRELNESSLVLASAEAFHGLLTKTAEQIRQYLDGNQLVAFHGATAGLNSFFSITGLGNHPNIRLYDGDILKEGLYLPACSARIMPPTDVSYAKNALVVISAVSFFEQIERFAVETAGLDRSQIIPLIGTGL